jgi:hypothetical protein
LRLKINDLGWLRLGLENRPGFIKLGITMSAVLPVCGNKIRLFSTGDYSDSHKPKGEILAYEISDPEGEVLTRARTSSGRGYCFLD